MRGEATGCHYAMPNQYENADNVKAHYETTGPEIWRQTEGQVQYFFAGFGTCGTISGTGRYLKEQNPHIRVVAIEPQKGHRLPGLKNLEESKPPGILDRSVIDEVIRVTDEPAYAMTKRLFREEGLMVGPSTGAIVHAAVEYGKTHDGVAVAIACDSGLKYSSFFRDVLGDEGLPSDESWIVGREGNRQQLGCTSAIRVARGYLGFDEFSGPTRLGAGDMATILQLPESFEEDLRNSTRRPPLQAGEISAAEYRSFRVPRGVYEQRESETYMLRTVVLRAASCPTNWGLGGGFAAIRKRRAARHHPARHPGPPRAA